MLTFIIVLHVLVAFFMILVVLLQPGNRGGVSAALGGAGGETVFGGRGANTFLSKLTFAAAILFMFSNYTLSHLSSPDTSAMDKLLSEGNVAAEIADAPVAAPVEAAPKATK